MRSVYNKNDMVGLAELGQSRFTTDIIYRILYCSYQEQGSSIINIPTLWNIYRKITLQPSIILCRVTKWFTIFLYKETC